MSDKVLFGIDGSESCLETVAVAGEILKGRGDLDITLFHGTPGVHYPGLAEPAEESIREAVGRNARDVLDRARDTLVNSGFQRESVATVWQDNCLDPARSMLALADREGVGTIVLARRETTGVEPVPLGSVAYRLVYTADRRTIWLVDPPIPSGDVLVALV